MSRSEGAKLFRYTSRALAPHYDQKYSRYSLLVFQVTIITELPTTPKAVFKLTQFVRFQSSKPEPLEELGLNFASISHIFLAASSAKTPKIPLPSPEWARAFISREFKACELTFQAIERSGMEVPHPVTGEPTRSGYSFVRELRSVASLTLFKVFGDAESGFCLVFGGLTSRVTHIVLPSIRCVIYDLDQSASSEVQDASTTGWHSEFPAAAVQPRIALIDMVTNFAHQAMNHLSGIDRLIDSGMYRDVDEVWICGTEFFGPVENIFPELSGKTRRLSRHDVVSRLEREKADVYKIGSNVLTQNLTNRLLRLSWGSGHTGAKKTTRSPLIAFTTRSDGRRCLNLPDVVARIVESLLRDYPNLGVVLDGWVFPESSIQSCSNTVTALSSPYLNRMLQEADLCNQITLRLPPRVLVRNLIGTSLLESIQQLQDVDVYFAHIGTLQHKIGWFTRSKGIMHGPTAELTRMESATYSSEEADPPIAIRVSNVVDVPVDTQRGAGFYDYNIVDPSAIAAQIAGLLEGVIENRWEANGTAVFPASGG